MVLNYFPMSTEPNINVDLKERKKCSKPNVLQAYKPKFIHLKVSGISWSKTTPIILSCCSDHGFCSIEEGSKLLGSNQKCNFFEKLSVIL